MTEQSRLSGISAVIMASGHSVRFGGEKLWAEVGGVPMIGRIFSALPENLFFRVAVVARDDKILRLAEKFGLFPVYNDDQTNDAAVTIRKGLAAIPQNSAGCAFFVADQPFLRRESIEGLCRLFLSHTDSICAMSYRGTAANPVIFPASLFGELSSLQPNEKGKNIVRRHPELLLKYEAGDASELFDIDSRADLTRAKG